MASECDTSEYITSDYINQNNSNTYFSKVS